MASKEGLFSGPMFNAMKSGAVKWGDLMMNRRSRSSKSRSKSRNRRSGSRSRRGSRSRTHSALRSFKTPPLRLRADIYKTFPVIVHEVAPNLFAVKWHRDNLRAWKETHPTTWDEYQDYQEWTEVRLIHSLKRHSSLYEILPPMAPGEIIRFRMVSHVPPPKQKLMSLNDIKGKYPVIWHRLEGARPTFAIELRGDFKHRVAASEVVATERALLDDLRSSPSWVVIPPMGRNEVARIQMR